MGIRLDWEIEAEQERMRTSGEDPESVRARRRRQLRFVLFVGVVLLLFAAIVGGIALRLRQVDWEVEQLLRDTVDAEVSTLRIGDRSAFLTFQRSASEEWARRQETLFDRYQSLKLNQDVSLTGQILDVTIDGSRGRVRLEEIIDGAPYARVWFYWRYEDGWRHVPSDYTFWGDPRTIAGETVNVSYRSFDEPAAQALAPRVNEWVAAACAVLVCGDLPDITIEIVPDEVLETGWVASDIWRLQVPSPYTRDARMDMLFDGETQLAVANLLAERLVFQSSSGLQPTPGTDAAYLRQAVIGWLAGRFTQIDTNAYLMESLSQQHGEAAIGRLVQTLQPDSNIAFLNTIAGSASLDQANLDWRDFLTWRLRQENERSAAGDQAGFLALYDAGDPNVLNTANARFGTIQGERTVVSVLPQPGTPPTMRTLTQIAETGETEEVLFRLIDGVWKRAS
jgi:hypothetical protein